MNKLAVSIVIAAGIGVAALAIFLSGGFAPNGEGGELSESVAVVNGEEITQVEFDVMRSQIALQQGFDPSALGEEAQAEFNAGVVDSLIAQTLIKQAAAQLGREISDEEVDAQIEVIKGQFESQAAFEEALRAEGVSEEEMRSEVRAGLATEPYLEQELTLSAVTATDAEITAAYDEVSAGGEVPPLEEVYDQVRDLVILEKQQELVAAHVEELKAGADIEILI